MKILDKGNITYSIESIIPVIKTLKNIQESQSKSKNRIKLLLHKTLQNKDEMSAYLESNKINDVIKVWF